MTTELAQCATNHHPGSGILPAARDAAAWPRATGRSLAPYYGVDRDVTVWATVTQADPPAAGPGHGGITQADKDQSMATSESSQELPNFWPEENASESRSLYRSLYRDHPDAVRSDRASSVSRCEKVTDCSVCAHVP